MGTGSTTTPLWQRPGAWTPVTLLFAAVFLWMLYLTAIRAIFPWDILVWAESPFMTNMLKLGQGLSVYSPPEQANSFVYTPGLEYITYTLLSPFGLETDIRYCRLITVLIGLSAAWVSAISAYRLALLADPQKKLNPVTSIPAFFLLFTLIIFRNFVADIPHPDNLYILHFSLCFLLTLRALQEKSMSRAILAILFASIGIWTKQLAGGAIFGVGAALLMSNWNRRQLITLTAIATVSWLASVSMVLLPDLTRFYTIELLSKHAVEWGKITGLLWDDLLLTPHRALLFAAAAWALLKVWWPNQALRPYLILWATLGVADVLPAYSAYLKAVGLSNNLIIIDLWVSLLLAPVMSGFMLQNPRPGSSLLAKSIWPAYGVLLALSMAPEKMAPDEDYWRYATTLQNAVTADVEAGRSVLVDHGAMFLIKAGNYDVPLDRSNSYGELRTGNQQHLAGTQQRISGQYYDRIYLTTGWYGEPTNTLIKTAYRRVYQIPKAQKSFTWSRGLRGGIQSELTSPALVFERNPDFDATAAPQ